MACEHIPAKNHRCDGLNVGHGCVARPIEVGHQCNKYSKNLALAQREDSQSQVSPLQTYAET